MLAINCYCYVWGCSHVGCINNTQLSYLVGFSLLLLYSVIIVCCYSLYFKSLFCLIQVLLPRLSFDIHLYDNVSPSLYFQSAGVFTSEISLFHRWHIDGSCFFIYSVTLCLLIGVFIYIQSSYWYLLLPFYLVFGCCCNFSVILLLLSFMVYWPFFSDILGFWILLVLDLWLLLGLYVTSSAGYMIFFIKFYDLKRF